METLFGYMDCVPPVAYATFSDINKELAACYCTVADNTMIQAVREIEGDDSDDLICNIAVSCDGTWQRRDIPRSMVLNDKCRNRKVIDYRVLAKKYAQCTA